MSTDSSPIVRTPLRVVPHYAGPAPARCHVHHADGVAAALVGTTALVGPLVTRLRGALATESELVGWFTAIRDAGVIGAATAVERDGNRHVHFAGEIEVWIETPYGFEVHVGGDDVEALTPPASAELRFRPRPTPSVSGTSLERGTVVADGAVLMAGQPVVEDVRASIAELEAAPVTEPATEPEPEPGAEAERAVASRHKVDVVPDDDADRSGDADAEDEMVLVRGLQCRMGHHNHPDARLCAQCGDAMQNQSMVLGPDGQLGVLGVRPPLGILTFDDGQAYQLNKTTVIGRLPGEETSTDGVLAFPEDDTMSRRHVAIELDGWNVAIKDLGSSNGTGVRFPGAGDYARLQPHQSYALPSNTVVVVGNRWLTYTATSAAPPAPAR